MLFPTVTFAVFFVVVFVVSWLLRPYRVPWRLFMVAASWFFYGYWEPRFVLLLAGSSLGNWVAGELVVRTLEDGRRTGRTRAMLALAVAANLGVLGWFKYYGFFATSVQNRLLDLGVEAPLPLIQVTLPVGISFFTFQAISYVVDLARGTTRPLPLLDFFVYLAFFPHLVAGPIVRASEFGPQLLAKADWRSIPAAAAFALIVAGLFKKVVISSYLSSEIVDPVFGAPGAHSSAEILVAFYAYAVQIYADFSGYTDIAIGCALLLGIRFPQNFDAPYTATSLQEFWRRWHMSLSRWLRDYLYIPLGGNRGSALFTARNLMLTMVLGGLWHGAAWTFVAWGAIHGVGLVLERGLRALLPGFRSLPGARLLAWLLTFHLVTFAWVFFRAESFGDARELLTRLFTAGGPAPLVSPLLLLAIAAPLAAQFVPRDAHARLLGLFTRAGPVLQGATLAVALVVIDALGPAGVAPFIYFQF